MSGWKIWLAQEDTWLLAIVHEADLEKAEALALVNNPGAAVSSLYAPIEVDGGVLNVETVNVGSVKTIKSTPHGMPLKPEPGAPDSAS